VGVAEHAPASAPAAVFKCNLHYTAQQGVGPSAREALVVVNRICAWRVPNPSWTAASKSRRN
jgi:hypothetical protein